MAKHGAEAHYLRPDVTYRTSVLQSTVGYNPVADAQAVAARFVAPMGLAGSIATRHYLAAPAAVPVYETTPASWWTTFVARTKARWDIMRLRRAVRRAPVPDYAPAAPAAPATVPVMTLDTSPRPGAALMQDGISPASVTPVTAMAPMIAAQGGPPLTDARQAAMAMTPEAAWPATFWQDVIADGLPPIVAARGGNDALYKWFSRGRR